jgi:hypothetical protein
LIQQDQIQGISSGFTFKQLQQYAGTSNMPISLGTTKVKCLGTQGALIKRGYELKEPTG